MAGDRQPINQPSLAPTTKVAAGASPARSPSWWCGSLVCSTWPSP